MWDYLRFCRYQQVVVGKEGEPLSLEEILFGAPVVGHPDDSSVADTAIFVAVGMKSVERVAECVTLDLVVADDMAAPLTFDFDDLWIDLVAPVVPELGHVFVVAEE